MNETPMHAELSGKHETTGYIKKIDDDSSRSTALHALSSMSFSVDQVIELFGKLISKLDPILTPDGGSDTDPVAVSGDENSYVFRDILANELKLNYLAQHIQDVTRRVDL